MQPERKVTENGTLEQWFLGDKLHREDGPAYIRYRDGKVVSERWFIDNKRHRLNDPAVIIYEDGKIIAEQWWVTNFLHRENGPAIISYVNSPHIKKIWYLNGRELFKRDFTSIEMIDRMKAYSLFNPIEIARLKRNAD